MCDNCVEIEEKLARYRRLYRAVSDAAVLRHLKEMIAELEAQQLLLHPEGRRGLAATRFRDRADVPSSDT